MSNFFLWSWQINIIIIPSQVQPMHMRTTIVPNCITRWWKDSCQWQWFGQLWGTTEQPTRSGFQTFAIFIPILGNLYKAVPFAKYYSAQLFPGKHRPNKRTWPSRWRSWPILTWKRLTRPQGIEQGRCGILMALCSPARTGELCHASMSSVTLVSHCFTSLLIFAAFSGLNLHVWLVVMAICEDEFHLKVGPCRRPNGCFILETLKLKTKGAASHRSQGTRGSAGWQTVPLKIVPYEYVHSLVPSVALYTAANTSTKSLAIWGKAAFFLPCCRSIQN